MQISGKGMAIGLLADAFMGTFPLGAGIGAFARALFNPNANDLSDVFDPKRATQGSQTEPFGDLKGMANGLFGTLRGILDGLEQSFGNPTPAQPVGKTSNNAGKQTQRKPPKDNAEAQRYARPRVDAQAQTEAASQSSPGWKKVLLWGGVALAGLSLLNNMPFFGNMGMPYYGAGFGHGFFPGLNF